MKLAFTVPGPPVPKERPRVVTRDGKSVAFTPEATRDYEKHVRTVAWAHTLNSGWPLRAHYSLVLRVYRKRATGDWDNYAKAICDGAEGQLWHNDRQIRRATVDIIDGDPNPRVEVEVETL